MTTNRKPECLTVSEERRVAVLVAKGMNAVSARQLVIEQRFKRYLPAPARGF